MGKASSAKKVARVAKAGKGTKVRSTQGQVFYISLAVVVIVGVALIIFARTSGRTAAVAEPPTLTDHWHTAYGVYACDHFLTAVQNQNDPNGIHTHGDGVIHVHPFSSVSTGSNAKLGVFFNAAGIKMSNTKLEMPENLGTYENGKDCKGKPANLRVAVWDDATGTAAPRIYTSDFKNIRFTNDRMAMTIAWVPDDVNLDKLKPPSIPTLDQLSDVGTTPTTVAGATTVPGATTAPGAATVPRATTTTATTTPSSSTSG